jgi:thioredoxin reductase (NADPH)
MANIKVYSAPGCPWCKKTKKFLKQNNIAFEDLNVAEDKHALNELIEKTGQIAVPVLDIDGTIIIGYDVTKIKEALKMIQMTENMYEVVIIGGGVSGLSAAIYAGRFLMKTAVVAEKPGGTIVLTDDVANYPGFKRISGLELGDKLQEHMKDYDIELLEKRVEKVERCKEGCFKVFTGVEYLHTKTIIFATGTEWRTLNIAGEKEYTGKGVHYCALCDGAFYKDKLIGVVGGSDSAAKEALLLAEYGKKVYIIYRGEKIRPEPINLKRVIEHKNIEVINNTNVIEIKGDKYVTSVIFDKPYKGSTGFQLDALFIEIGHRPLSRLAKAIGVALNEKEEIIIDREAKTNIEGVFAAGDVVDTKFKQAITGVAEGVTAAYSAYHYVNETELICLCDDED